MMKVPEINIQAGQPGRIIVRNRDGVPKFLFTDHEDLYKVLKSYAERYSNDKFDDKDMEYCIKDIPCNHVPYSNKLLFDDLDPEVVREALANHEKFLNDYLGIKFKEVIKPMKHTKLVKTVYIFAKEWEFEFPERDHLTATRIYDYRDDMDDLLASIREADCVMLVPDDLIQDTARFVQITGYDVHYDLSNNEITLHMVVTNAD